MWPRSTRLCLGLGLGLGLMYPLADGLHSHNPKPYQDGGNQDIDERETGLDHQAKGRH